MRGQDTAAREIFSSMLKKLPYSAFERDAFVRTAEVALSVANRRDLFMWMRLHLNRFVPHDLALCQVLPVQAGSIVAHVFHSTPLADDLHHGLCRSGDRLWVALREGWLKGGRRATSLRLKDLASSPEAQGLRQAGFEQLLVHGVDASARLRPEALFAFASTTPQAHAEEAHCAGLDLWMPYLHACAVRSLTGDDGRPVSAGRAAPKLGGASPLTAREIQVLTAVRDAKRTVEIGEQLGISPLTVKNHLRKIMEKLGARSRVHAVAEAMARQIIS